jgi:hypothetical protein
VLSSAASAAADNDRPRHGSVEGGKRCFEKTDFGVLLVELTPDRIEFAVACFERMYLGSLLGEPTLEFVFCANLSAISRERILCRAGRFTPSHTDFSVTLRKRLIKPGFRQKRTECPRDANISRTELASLKGAKKSLSPTASKAMR